MHRHLLFLINAIVVLWSVIASASAMRAVVVVPPMSLAQQEFIAAAFDAYVQSSVPSLEVQVTVVPSVAEMQTLVSQGSVDIVVSRRKDARDVPALAERSPPWLVARAWQPAVGMLAIGTMRVLPDVVGEFFASMDRVQNSGGAVPSKNVWRSIAALLTQRGPGMAPPTEEILAAFIGIRDALEESARPDPRKVHEWCVWLTNPSMPESEQLETALLQMHLDPQGRSVLQRLGISAFIRQR